MKKLVARKLQKLAQRTLAEHAPTVVAVTGSVGKTSTRQAIATALAGTFDVRSPKKNYNNEFGVPLTILGETSPGRNAWEWVKLFVRAMRRKAVYPNMLVLEYGADRAGDIAALCDIAEPDVAVITAISPVHLANYRNFDALVNEKAMLGERVKEGGLVVLNADDSRVASMARRMAANVVSYGIHTDADVRGVDVRLETRHDRAYKAGETFAVTRAGVQAFGEEGELVLTNMVGEAPVACCLAAIAVAHRQGISVVDACARLSKGLAAMPGRLHPIAGIKGSLILDDTYNAAPASVLAGLQALAMFEPGDARGRRIVVLGKMAELGTISEAEHAGVGREVAAVADLFLAAGAEMKAAADAAVAAGMDREHVEWVQGGVEAGRYLDRVLQPGDVVLVKGSQSARMERAVKDIMADPAHAGEVLVRQEEYWQSS